MKKFHIFILLFLLTFLYFSINMISYGIVNHTKIIPIGPCISNTIPFLTGSVTTFISFILFYDKKK